MKLFSGIFIICALVTEASVLKCFNCVDATRNCTENEAVCDPALNLTCTAVLITEALGATNSNLFVKGCGICPEPTSFNHGFVAQTVESSCCSSDLCNDQRHEVKENTTLNGLECFGCYNDSAETCARSTSILKCVGIQNRCYHDSFAQANAGTLIVQKGCVSENICRPTESSPFGVQTTSDSLCCKGNLCNKEMSLPGLQCHSCVSVAGKCKPLTIQCTSSSCRSLHIKQVTGGTPREFLVNGCGNCTGTLSFNSSAFAVYAADSCCQSDLCNNQVITEEANSTLNGLECYRCLVFSNQVPEDPKEKVKCVGEQRWCLHLLGTYNSLQNVTVKGCASESICKNPDVLKPYNFYPKQEFYCCQGSGCNRGRARTEVSTVQTTTGTVTD